MCCLRLDHLKPSAAPRAAFGENSPRIMKWECVSLSIRRADTDGIHDTAMDRTKPLSSAKFRVISPFFPYRFPLSDLDLQHCVWIDNESRTFFAFHLPFSPGCLWINFMLFEHFLFHFPFFSSPQMDFGGSVQYGPVYAAREQQSTRKGRRRWGCSLQSSDNYYQPHWVFSPQWHSPCHLQV